MRHIPIVMLCAAVTTIPGTSVRAATPDCQNGAPLVCGPASASGAVLSSASGGQISHGQGFQPAKAGTQLKVGDRVLVGDAGLRLVLGPACTATLAPHTLATITQKGGALCASLTVATRSALTDADLRTVATTADQKADSTLLGSITPTQAAIGLGGLAAVGVIVGVGVSSGSSGQTTATTVSAQ